MAHALDTLTLVTFGHIGSDEWKWNGVEVTFQHGVCVVNESAGDGVLVGGETDVEC